MKALLGTNRELTSCLLCEVVGVGAGRAHEPQLIGPTTTAHMRKPLYPNRMPPSADDHDCPPSRPPTTEKSSTNREIGMNVHRGDSLTIARTTVGVPRLHMSSVPRLRMRPWPGA